MHYSEKLVDKLYLLSNCFLVFTLVLPKAFFNSGIFLWSLSFILNIIWKRRLKLSQLLLSKVSLGFIGIYSLYLLGLFWTDNFESGLKILERGLFYIVAPLILIEISFFSKKKLLKYIYLSFILACLSLLIYGFITGLYKSRLIPNIWQGNLTSSEVFLSLKWNYTYQIFAKHMGMHAVYLSVYLIFAFFLSLDLLRNKKLESRLQGLLKCALPLFVISLFLLQSAMMIFLFIFLCSLWYLRNIADLSSWKTPLFFAISLCGFVYVLIMKSNFTDSNNKLWILISFFMIGLVIPYLLKLLKGIRIKPIYALAILMIGIMGIMTISKVESVNDFAQNNPSNVTARILKWKASTEVIEDNLWIGVGTGATSDELLLKYDEMNFKAGIEHNYNEHNQYLRFWMENGILSLVLFLFVLLSLLILMEKVDHFPLLVLTLLLLFFSFSETPLAREKGVTFFVYFSVFYSFYFLNSNSVQTIRHESKL